MKKKRKTSDDMLKFTMVDIPCRMESKLQKGNYKNVKIL